MTKRKKQDYEPPTVFGLCDHCGQSGISGVEIHPWSVALKVIRWMHRECKNEVGANKAGSSGSSVQS